jgi:hypothetical protein
MKLAQLVLLGLEEELQAPQQLVLVPVFQQLVRQLVQQVRVQMQRHRRR